MAVTQNSIQALCDQITQEISANYNGLSLHFVIHGIGRMREAIALAEHDVIAHPAGQSAQAILHKNSGGERSKFLGLAIARENKMFGFQSTDHVLGLFTINKDHYKDDGEALSHLYHLVWHAIDLYEIRQLPVYKKKFKSGPMVPKRSPLNFAKANLQADMFATIMRALNLKQKNSITNVIIQEIPKSRGSMSLLPLSNYKAEDYPSIIALESCQFMIEDMLKNPTPAEQIMPMARQASVDIGRAFDEQNIKQWWDFSIPAQDMAWRGFKKEEILGAAINTSNNPFVRSIGYLIQDVTKLEPASTEMLEHSYNAFVDPDVNMKKHAELIDTVFEEAITEGGEDDTGNALIRAANKQNEDLTEGHILGWCANALQDAAKAVERAMSAGTSPVQAARMHFKGNQYLPEWNDLKNLGDKIVDQRRQGFAVTMGHIAEICHNNPDFAPVLDSLKITMNDPSYIQKLEAANDLDFAPSAPFPSAPAPSTPVPKGPMPNMPMPTAAPTLGGSGHNAQIAQHNHRLAQKQKQDSETTDNHTE